jgi:voltage-gated sodium channel
MERAEQELRDQALEFSRSVMENRRLSRKMSEVTNFKTAQKSLQRVTNSTEFELVMASAIFANAIMLGVECNYFAVTRTHDVPDAFFAIGLCFTVLFTLELLLRLGGEGFSFFYNSNWLWNYLDFVIVVSSLFELTVDLMRILGDKNDGASASSGLASMRILRLVRITRLMRIFRISKLIRLIKALQTLVYSILCTLKSLVWAMLLLILLIYVFGIIITQATTDFLVDTLPEDAAMWHVVNLYWGNLGSSMFTLFKCISNGVSWDLVVEPLGEISVSLLIIFNMFIVFAYFSVLNVVTGVFCQSAIDAAQHDKDMLIQNHVMHRERYTIKAQNLFAKIKETTSLKSSSNKEFLTLTEFEEALQNWEVQAFFDALEVDATDAWALFKLLDTECTHRVSIGEFIDGCMRVKGSAKSVDMIRLIQDQQTLRLQLMHFKDSTEVRLVWLMKILGDVLCVDTSEIAAFTGLSNSHSHDCDD